jgi:hypothetical protein
MKWIGYKKLGQSRRTGGGRKPDFIGLLNNNIYIGETKSSKELNSLKKVDNKRSSICYYDDLGDETLEIKRWFEKVDCTHDPPCLDFGGKVYSSSRIRHIIADFVSQKKDEFNLKSVNLILVRFLLFTILSQIACYFYRFICVLDKEEIKDKNKTNDLSEIINHCKEIEVKGMLAIPSEFKNELQKAIDILGSSEFQAIVKQKTFCFLFQSIEITPLKNILLSQISYKKLLTRSEKN